MTTVFTAYRVASRTYAKVTRGMRWDRVLLCFNADKTPVNRETDVDRRKVFVHHCAGHGMDDKALAKAAYAYHQANPEQ